MNRFSGILAAAAAGIAGAALFFLVAFLLNWGGLGDDDTLTVTIPGDTPPQLAATPVTTADSMGTTQIYDEYADSVVQIVATFEGMNNFFHSGDQQGIGSGFVVSDEGYILTNAHVVTQSLDGSGPAANAKSLQVKFKDGTDAQASIVGYDITGSDVAVIKIEPGEADLVPVVLGDSSVVKVGEPVVAIGSPFGIYSSSLTAGVVSAVDRNVESPEAGFVIQDAIQTDAAINRGNSGGPLFNALGQVIGINEQIISSSGGFEGVGFAVPINTAQRVMDEIIATGQVEYAWMGVVGQSVNEDVAGEFDLSVDHGAMVTEVLADGPSDKAGIKSGDVILKVDDNEITKMEDVTELLIDYDPGDKIRVTYIRDGEEMQAEVELGSRPENLTRS